MISDFLLHFCSVQQHKAFHLKTDSLKANCNCSAFPLLKAHYSVRKMPRVYLVLFIKWQICINNKQNKFEVTSCSNNWVLHTWKCSYLLAGEHKVCLACQSYNRFPPGSHWLYSAGTAAPCQCDQHSSTTCGTKGPHCHYAFLPIAWTIRWNAKSLQWNFRKHWPPCLNCHSLDFRVRSSTGEDWELLTTEATTTSGPFHGRDSSCRLRRVNQTKCAPVIGGHGERFNLALS